MTALRSELNSLNSSFYSIKDGHTLQSYMQSQFALHTSYSISKRSGIGSVGQLTVAGSILGSTATDDDVLGAIFTQFSAVLEMISWEQILPRGYCVRRLRLLGSTQTASQGLKEQSFAALLVGKLRAPMDSAARMKEDMHAVY